MPAITDMRVVILSPIMYPDPKFIKCTVNMVAYSWLHGIRVEEMGITEREVVDWARNNLARAAVEKECEYTPGEKYTHLLWLDSDHMFNPDLLVRLASHDVDMVSALYFGRTEPYLPVVYVNDASPDPYKHYPLIEAPNTVFECDAVGFGALLMRRDVFERVPEPWFTIDYRAGEDIAFCVKARQHGIKIFCDGAYKLGHIGSAPVITEQTYLKYMDEHKDEYADRVKIELEGTNNGPQELDQGSD